MFSARTLIGVLCLSITYIVIKKSQATVSLTMTLQQFNDVTTGSPGLVCLRADDCQYEYTYCADTNINPTSNCKLETVTYRIGERITFVRMDDVISLSGLSFPVDISFIAHVQDNRINRNTPNDYIAPIITQAEPLTFTRDLVLATGAVPDPAMNPDRTFRVTWSYNFVCDRDFYTATCDVFCQAQSNPTDGFFTCNTTDGTKVCVLGYKPPDCKLADRCVLESLDCGSYGTCCIVQDTNTPSCCCDTGYTGPLCDTKCDVCSPNPCQNGGTCISGSTNYMCACPDGCTGHTCEIGNVIRTVNLSLYDSNTIRILAQCPVIANGGFSTVISVTISCGAVPCFEDKLGSDYSSESLEFMSGGYGSDSDDSSETSDSSDENHSPKNAANLTNSTNGG